MIVEVITSGVHNREKFEQIFHLGENNYLLSSYFRNENKETKCQWHAAKSSDGENFEITSRIGSCEIINECTSVNSFKEKALKIFNSSID